ncbi:polysaccharide biosynthesis/export family protein [Fundidesulfovibrio terrae]|uniref:polysaccharide biosynthesis/export family protein n=1 Tax=Fundidesulfovibrio terrae TaxID=2922866 RepID=UPI001FAFF7E7|nr:polysaccharide biosynthesis/export family protein [Fundidesulfovibrio terrae]
MNVWHMTPLRAAALILTVVLCVAGCAKPAKKSSEMALEPVDPVTIAAGDVLEFRFTYATQFNDSQAVRSDGKIDLPMVGEVQAEGKSLAQLRRELSEMYSGKLNYPDLTVIMRSQSNLQVYVGGEVRSPGLIRVRNRMTALEAVMRAGGQDPKTAAMSSIIVVRHKGDERYGCKVDLTDELDGKAGKVFWLQPGDIVWVPRTVITQVNDFVEQYINKMVPRTGMAASITDSGAGPVVKSLGVQTNF